jgi:D-sedoheptulose 7-phosphate isomerase
MNYEENYISSIHNLLKDSLCNEEGKEVGISTFMNSISELTSQTKRLSGRIFFVGNGASAAFSNHMALDWSKNGKVNSYALSDSALLTALANDYSYQQAFVEYLKIEKCTKNDLVVTISSSGNSPNIVSTLEYCKNEGTTTIGLSGLKADNSTRKLANFSLYVPAKTYGMVECIHQIFLHMWLDKYMNIYEWDRASFQNMNSDEFTL